MPPKTLLSFLVGIDILYERQICTFKCSCTRLDLYLEKDRFTNAFQLFRLFPLWFLSSAHKKRGSGSSIWMIQEEEKRVASTDKELSSGAWAWGLHQVFPWTDLIWEVGLGERCQTCWYDMWQRISKKIETSRAFPDVAPSSPQSLIKAPKMGILPVPFYSNGSWLYMPVAVCLVWVGL